MLIVVSVKDYLLISELVFLLFVTILYYLKHFLCPLIHKLQFYFNVAFIIVYKY